jgi:hypothetical protein
MDNGTETQAFEDEALLDCRKVHAEYQFRLDGIPVNIHVQVYEELEPNNPSEPYSYSTSHLIKTPSQLDVYTPGECTDDDPEWALNKAIRSLTEHYRQAVSQGHQPSEDWLVPNDKF